MLCEQGRDLLGHLPDAHLALLMRGEVADGHLAGGELVWPDEHNVNLLTRGTVDMEPEPLIGTWIYNGIPCRIRKKRG